MSNKFKGGVWLGIWAYTWPFGRLEVSSDYLVVSVEGLPFYNKKIERRFTHENLEKIKVMKYFPIIAYGINVVSRDKKIESPICFWYVSFKFKKLINTLKEFNWMT